eukprot:gnl/MRDRNA2_/MRDRNA2_108127_c0_seq1.p1 gnl/MRDRNA2_/MRDRNA2_108127_c0~~gnl/MRDRNA2_/MRDRNA2_108127_c0_seq1.p1  ORF type:complete len:288 (-),score=68.69 gnl/MRDRNA2_/MRDRNA2_108127_c0_seq1:33-827(-)
MSGKLQKFDVQYAKSSMSTCRVCMAKIVKDSLRVGHVVVDVDNDGKILPASDYVSGATRWYHFECFHKMRGEKWFQKNLPPNPEKTVCGFKDVNKTDQKKVKDLWAALRVNDEKDAKGKKRKTMDDDQELPAGKRAKAAASKAAAKGTVKALTSVQGVLSNKDFQKVQKLEAELDGKSIAQLQSELEKNKQVRGGKKSELVQRVAEGRVLGSLPNCPKCTYGRVHWSRLGGWYSCPGYYDKDIQANKRCFFRTKELKRKAWKKM